MSSDASPIPGANSMMKSNDGIMQDVCDIRAFLPRPEVRGLTRILIKAISRTVQLIQQHRGFSSALLGGNKAMQDRLATKEAEAVAAFSAMETKLPLSLASSESFRRIGEDWERLPHSTPFIAWLALSTAHLRSAQLRFG